MNEFASKGKRKNGGQAAINAHAVRAVVQMLFATGKPYTLETLREKLREFFVEEGDYEKRAVASMSAVQLITAILEAGPQREALGLQIRLTNGVAQIFTSKIQNERLSAFIAERAPMGAGGAGELPRQHLRCWRVSRSSSRFRRQKLIRFLGTLTSGTWCPCSGRWRWSRSLRERMGGCDSRRRGGFWNGLALGRLKSLITSSRRTQLSESKQDRLNRMSRTRNFEAEQESRDGL